MKKRKPLSAPALSPLLESLEGRLLLNADTVPPQTLGVDPLPAEGGSITAAIDLLTVQVSEDLQAAGVNNPANWELRGAGVDGLLGTPDDRIYTLAASPAYTSGAAISLALSPKPLQEDLYRLTAFASGLQDLAGNLLDGNGDGTGGDNFVRNFSVTAPFGLVIENTSNDTLANATPMEEVEGPAGSGLLMARGLGTINPFVQNNNWSDPDYWSFEALAGDRISVAVDAIVGSGLDPYVELRNAADGVLATDNDSGPGGGAYISHYQVPTSGTYYVRAGHYWASPGGYHLRVDIGRNMQMESDGAYGNDSISGANRLALDYTGGHLQARVAGTIMAPETWTNTDEDFFWWGQINAGNTVELNVSLPAWSTITPKVTLLDAAGNAVTDTDGDLTDGHFLGTVPSNGLYYAKVESRNLTWAHNGRMYTVLSPMTWANAEAAAVALGGHLATINDAAEQTYLQQTIGPMADWLWIGMNDVASHTNWVWSSGQAVTAPPKWSCDARRVISAP